MRQNASLHRLDTARHDRAAAATAAAVASEPAASGASASALPGGWTCLKDCNLSGLLSRPVPIPFVLLHPEVGVALLEVDGSAPPVPEAEAVLRQRLQSARFDCIFPGYLPIVHLRLAPGEIGAIDSILGEAFAALPELSIPGGDAWASVLRRALSPRDPSRGASFGPGAPAAATSASAAGRAIPAEQTPPPPTGPRPVASGGMAASGWPGARPVLSTPPPMIRTISRAPAVAADQGRTVAPEAQGPATVPAEREETDTAGHVRYPDDSPPAVAPPAEQTPPPPPSVLASLADRLRRMPLPAVAGAVAGVTALVALGAVLAIGGGSPSRPVPSQVASAPQGPVAAPAAPRGDLGATTAARSGANPSGPAPAEAGTSLPRPTAPPNSTTASRPPTAAAPALPPPPPATTPVAPSPPPAQADSGSTVTVRTPANLRTGPGNREHVIRTTRRGERFRALDRTRDGWVQVGAEDKGAQGWIHSSMLTEKDRP
jgi:hypothetical protein